jgi:hypothetical protein
VAASRELATGHLGASQIWQAFAVLVPLCALTVAWTTNIVREAVA